MKKFLTYALRSYMLVVLVFAIIYEILFIMGETQPSQWDIIIAMFGTICFIVRAVFDEFKGGKK